MHMGMNKDFKIMTMHHILHFIPPVTEADARLNFLEGFKLLPVQNTATKVREAHITTNLTSHCQMPLEIQLHLEYASIVLTTVNSLYKCTLSWANQLAAVQH